jgi:hypothetical protein
MKYKCEPIDTNINENHRLAYKYRQTAKRLRTDIHKFHFLLKNTETSLEIATMSASTRRYTFYLSLNSLNFDRNQCSHRSRLLKGNGKFLSCCVNVLYTFLVKNISDLFDKIQVRVLRWPIQHF